MEFFISDQHFDHKNIIEHCKRPFSCVEEMNEIMVEQHNKTVKPKDLVYYGGDFSFKSHEKWLKRLNGKHHLILGNHDNYRSAKEAGFVWVRDVYQVKINGILIWLSHYAHRVWPQSHYGSWHLFGHNHGTLPPLGKSFGISVEYLNYTPISFDQVKERMDKIIVTEYEIFGGEK